MAQYRFNMKADQKTGLILPEDFRRGTIVADSKDEAAEILESREQEYVIYRLTGDEQEAIDRGEDPQGKAHQALHSQEKPYKLKSLKEV